MRPSKDRFAIAGAWAGNFVFRPLLGELHRGNPDRDWWLDRIRAYYRGTADRPVHFSGWLL